VPSEEIDQRVVKAMVHNIDVNAEAVIINLKGGYPRAAIEDLKQILAKIVPKLKGKVILLQAVEPIDVYQFLENGQVIVRDESI